MDDRKKEYLDVLNQKLDALTKVLNSTKRLKLTGEGESEQLEQEAEAFSSLYEQRANVITKIEKMDESLAQFKDLENDKQFAKVRQPVVDKIKKTAKAIAELDKKNIEISNKLMEFLKGNLKKIRDGRDINNAYTEDHVSTSGYHFDSTK